MTSSDSTSDLSQLIRYSLTIDNLNDEQAVGRARMALTALTLIVDQIEAGTPGRAEVATIHAETPGTDDIRLALREEGFELLDISRQVG
ncbi:hypothetical protein [Hymenobacter profundi]|uniref:Uncharacterized protein n=1 Tax=Hymenobacter profundi TaxID=1982110 RepID=A0ABS6WYU8_9BACT|nr:hypothetical protein [Hymenobacter profundi]MBW3128740.1 hypothetical protein [Hymenobacter profundi]